MTKKLIEGIDGAVGDLIAGLEVMERYIEATGLTDHPVVRLRDNLRRTIDAWKNDIRKDR